MKFFNHFLSIILFLLLITYLLIFVYAYPHWVYELGPSGSVTLNVISTFIHFIIFSVVFAGIFGKIRKSKLEKEAWLEKLKIKQETNFKKENERKKQEFYLELVRVNSNSTSIALSEYAEFIQLVVRAIRKRSEIIQKHDKIDFAKFVNDKDNMEINSDIYEKTKKSKYYYDDFKFRAIVLSNKYNKLDYLNYEHIFIFFNLINKIKTTVDDVYLLLNPLKDSECVEQDFTKWTVALEIAEKNTKQLLLDCRMIAETDALQDWASRNEDTLRALDYLADGLDGLRVWYICELQKYNQKK